MNYSTYWNGVSTTRYGYDGRGMISSIHHVRTAYGLQGNLAHRTYWRDNRDRITAWQRGTDNSLNGKEIGDGDKFQYDAEGQLTDAWYLAQDPGGNMNNPLVQEHFQYDQLGNRFGSNQTISYGTINFLRRDNGLNQYSSWTPSVIYHDDNFPGWTGGNGVLMADGWITASYNALNQPVAIWSPGTPNYVWFGFDPLGRCVKRWGSGSDPATNPATYFYYDGWNMIEEGPGGGGVTRVYAYGARVDEIVASSNEFGAVLFHHYDALGNCILLSDGAGNLSEQYDYEAFGKPYFYNTIGTNIPESPWKNRYLGKGREWLADLKLYDNRHRLYAPELGRFLQPDPLHFAAGDYNLYRYCHNDPVNKTDPFGLVDLSYTPEDVPNSGLRAWEATYNNPRAYDVAGHGDRNNMYDKNMKPITPQQVAKDIVSDKNNYKPGDPINLISCETGKDGKGSFGDRLSKEMKNQTGKETKVTAPQKEVGPKLDKAGNIVPGSKPQQPGIDIWRRFKDKDK